MYHRRSALLSLAAVMLITTGVGGSVTQLRAQEATASPAVAQASAAQLDVPAGDVEVTAAPAVSPDAGPRIVPPLERYQPSLPQHDRSENAAAAAGGGRHTLVLSTLALVLVVIIIVLLAVK